MSAVPGVKVILAVMAACGSEWGKRGAMTCPECGAGRLEWAVSAEDGRIAASCSESGCREHRKETCPACEGTGEQRR